MDYEDAKRIDVEEVEQKRYPTLSEDDDLKDKSISDATDYDTNITVSKVNNYEKSKTTKVRQQVSIPTSRESAKFLEARMPTKRLSIVGIIDYLTGTDPTKELDQVCHLMKSQQALSAWSKNDISRAKLRPDLENLDVGAIHKLIQRIDTPRVNYELLDKKIKTVVGKRFVNFYLNEKGEIFSSGKNI